MRVITKCGVRLEMEKECAFPKKTARFGLPKLPTALLGIPEKSTI